MSIPSIIADEFVAYYRPVMTTEVDMPDLSHTVWRMLLICAKGEARGDIQEHPLTRPGSLVTPTPR